MVYSFSPAANTCADLSLCGSGYDTNLYIYDGSPALQVACNDDACGLQSQILGFTFLAGHTYYIVVDGWGGDSGPYSLAISPCPGPCVLPPCPPGSIAEGEPDCGPDYVDVTNGGCNSTPPVFTDIGCNAMVGVLTSTLRWATGKNFTVEEITCRGKGGQACSYRISKTPIE